MFRALVLIVVPLVAACATFVDSRRDTGNLEGLRYSLPAPFLIVTPQPDGTLKTSIEMLPDPNRTYVLRTHSLVSSYSLDVQLENQMLKSVSMHGTSSAVAEQLAHSAGTVAGARIDARQAADAHAEQERTAAASAVREAELNLEIANATVDELSHLQNVPDEVLRQAQVAAREALVRRDAALRTQRQSASPLSAANAPGVNGALMSAGPMIFRIVPDRDGGVTLVAVRGPNMFPTSIAARTPAPSAGFTLNGPVRLRADAQGDFKFDAVYTRPVLQVRNVELYSKAHPGQLLQDLMPTTTHTAQTGGTKFSFVLDRQTPAGDYVLLLRLQVQGVTGSEAAIAEIDFSVIR